MAKTLVSRIACAIDKHNIKHDVTAGEVFEAFCTILDAIEDGRVDTEQKPPKLRLVKKYQSADGGETALDPRGLCPGGLPCDTNYGCPYGRPQCAEAIKRLKGDDVSPTCGITGEH